jgi:WD40 repeat protein
MSQLKMVDDNFFVVNMNAKRVAAKVAYDIVYFTFANYVAHCPFYTKQLASLLRGKLKQTVRVWNSKVIISNDNETCLYDLAKCNIIFKLSTPFLTMQLRDGSLLVATEDCLHVYSYQGTPQQSVALKNQFDDVENAALELQNGKIVICHNLIDILEYNRNTNKLTSLSELESFRYVRLTQLHDQRLVFVANEHNDLHIRDTEYKLLERIENKHWVYMCKELSPDLLLIGGRSVRMINLLTKENTEYIKDTGEVASIQFADNGNMIMETRTSILVANGSSIVQQVSKYSDINSTVGIYGSVILYCDSNGSIAAFDTHSNVIRKYNLPMGWEMVNTFVFDIK